MTSIDRWPLLACGFCKQVTSVDRCFQCKENYAYIRPCVRVFQNTVESLNRGHFGIVFLSFVRRLSSLGGPRCVETIGKSILGPQAVL